MRSHNLRSAPGTTPAERQLRPQTRVTLFLAALILLLAAPAAFAGSASATMQVSVTVLARAVVSVSSQPDVVTVTEADVARGFVDVATPIAVNVRTNSRAGYVLQVDRALDAFTRLDLSFGDSEMSVSDQSWISRPYVPGGESLVMRARLHLGAGAQPGSYPLGVAISARPL